MSLRRIAVLLLSALAGSASLALAQRDQPRDPLGFLKRAVAEAGAPALTAEQETQLNSLITDFRNTQPTAPDTALAAARTAYNAALLAGDLEAAQAQAQVIGNRMAALTSARLQAATTLQIGVLAVLKSGSQLEALRQNLGEERLIGLIGSLAGGPPFGGGRPGFGPGGEPGFRPHPGGPPGFAPTRQPGGVGQN